MVATLILQHAVSHLIMNVREAGSNSAQTSAGESLFALK